MVFQPGELTVFFFSSRRRHTRCSRDWSSDVCSSDLLSKIVTKRPGPGGTLVPCETWDNALLACEDRKSVVWGKSVDLGGRRIIKKKNPTTQKSDGDVA